MNKYYVGCGLVKEVVLAGNPIQAAIKAFQRLSGPTLVNGVITISERGFDFEAHEPDEDFLMNTSDVIHIMQMAARPFDDFENF